jgi:phenylalanyl-tRNA synthetase alpha chain
LVTPVTRKSYKITRAAAFAPTRIKKAADLTKEMLDSGAWKTTPFKPYNYLTLGEKVGGGYLHPLLKVRYVFVCVCFIYAYMLFTHSLSNERC